MYQQGGDYVYMIQWSRTQLQVEIHSENFSRQK